VNTQLAASQGALNSIKLVRPLIVNGRLGGTCAQMAIIMLYIPEDSTLRNPRCENLKSYFEGCDNSDIATSQKW
jgi:hypothetical protein